MMTSAVSLEMHANSPVTELAHNKTWAVGITFAALMAMQALGFLLLGMGRWGCGLSQTILCVQGLIALACTRTAYRRAQGIAALFWFLFAAVIAVLLLPTALQAYNTLSDQNVISESARSLLYCLYGAPVLMMLFLPETAWRAGVKSEIFLDLFQIAIVVSLIYSAFFFFPVRQMLPADAILRDIRISDVQSLVLLSAILLRLQFAWHPGTRNLLLRLGFFLFICGVTTLAGDWIYLHSRSASVAWFDLGWAVPQAIASLVAVTWVTPRDPAPDPPSGKFASFIATNLVLVTILCTTNLLIDRWKQAYGATLADAAMAASLLAFTLRLAIVQFSQQKEIAQRKTTQKQLTVSHERVGRLLRSARSQNGEITQISELGSLLHATASREEIFSLIPERLRRLFPNASGCVSLLSASKNRVESVSEWGMNCPAGQIFTPDECWALRRGRAHSHIGGTSTARCSHLRGEGPAVCVPLIANGEVFGTLVLQNDETSSVTPYADGEDNGEDSYFARRRDLAATVAEHIALAVANLNLREALRDQAIRDPLTGLYNRRYMQEFLDRELHTARRKHRSLSVMMLDLDHFKRYNDNFGHVAGDQALAAAAQLFLRSVRVEDIACRYGGEEFCLILTECSLRQACVRADEIRRRLQEYRGEIEGQPTVPLTISIGVAAFDETTDRVDQLLKFADEGLYQAKRMGGNRVVAARPAAPARNDAGLASAEIH